MLDPADTMPTAWAADVLARRGETVSAVTEVHRRAWSTVWRIDTDRGTCWLKRAPRSIAIEPALLSVLEAHGIPHVQRPMAIDAFAGLVLLPDGGGTVREASPEERGALWRGTLVQYARTQRAASDPAVVEALLAVGLPDLRLHTVPSTAAALMDRWAPEVRAELPRLADAAAELDAILPVTTIDHDDLHDANAFAATTSAFDWGDSCISHPFVSLLVASRVDSVTADESRAALDAYAGEWGLAGDEARRAVTLGVLLGRVARAAGWERTVDAAGADLPEHFRTAPRDWLLTLRDERRGGDRPR